MKPNPGTDQETFRDSISTAEKSGKRIWVYPTQPKGRLYRARTIVSIFLLGFLFGAPFIQLGGNPLILMDILGRRFIVFGLVFNPQDFYLFVLLGLIVLVFVVQFTAIFGRLFCGWICPQTIFMEMIFRRIEYWMEGGPAKQKKLREGHWTGIKTFKWLFKQGLFFGLASIICNTFLAYIIGVDRLYAIITDPPSEHVAGLTAMLIFTLLFYGVFAWFREQACTLVCPYGRLQGVLVDSNSIVVAYDHTRGEPRARYKKTEDRSDKGDCIECRACVAVCPTGIDIRNGTQLECVNCTGCIDACNSVMRKVNLPEGLIRYTSEDRLAGIGFRLRGRVVVYTVALVALVILWTTLLVTRTDIETTILRTPGTLFYENEDGSVRNLYSLKMTNKTFEQMDVSLKLTAPPGGTIDMVGGAIALEPEGVAETAFFVNFPRERLFSNSTMVTIEIWHGDEVIEELTTSFMGPQPGSER